jgi:hypothetical protein
MAPSAAQTLSRDEAIHNVTASYYGSSYKPSIGLHHEGIIWNAVVHQRNPSDAPKEPFHTSFDLSFGDSN